MCVCVCMRSEEQTQSGSFLSFIIIFLRLLRAAVAFWFSSLSCFCFCSSEDKRHVSSDFPHLAVTHASVSLRLDYHTLVRLPDLRHILSCSPSPLIVSHPSITVGVQTPRIQAVSLFESFTSCSRPRPPVTSSEGTSASVKLGPKRLPGCWFKRHRPPTEPSR